MGASIWAPMLISRRLIALGDLKYPPAQMPRPRKDRRYTPCSEEKKRKISETLSGAKLSAREYKPTPKELEDIDQLKRVYARGEGNLKFQSLLDWFHEGR